MSRQPTAKEQRVLDVLTKHPEGLYGLEIVKLAKIPRGSVYFVLDRMEQQGWVTSRPETNSGNLKPRNIFFKVE